jgi:predicted RNA-binding protein Jag
MKSVTEQASSIAKAIQKAWERAGKPLEFSIKIFEEPKTNFFGLTSQPAKVGLFFEVAQVQPAAPAPTPKPARPPRREARPARQPQPAPQPKEVHEPREPREPRETREPRQQPQEAEPREIWSENLMQGAREWLTGLLQQLNMSNISFQMQAEGYDLAILFEKPLIDIPARQQQLYRSMSLLLMQALRHKMLRPLRGFRVMLSHSS